MYSQQKNLKHTLYAIFCTDATISMGRQYLPGEWAQVTSCRVAISFQRYHEYLCTLSLLWISLPLWFGDSKEEFPNSWLSANLGCQPALEITRDCPP